MSRLAAGLRHVSHQAPGIKRCRAGKNFRYLRPDGRVVRDAVTLKRIRSLAIPPAYERVWISPDPRGHIQAVGRDARGRLQYRYHESWRKHRDDNKFERVLDFARALPRIRSATARDLRGTALSRRRVVAAVVALLEKTLIRVGNEEYARTNKSYGLTTLQDRHAKVRGSSIRFAFRGKSGVEHEVELEDRRLASIVKRCQDLPGADLFQYIDENGRRRDLVSDDVNAYLQEVTGKNFTAKDFRTWAGTVLAAKALHEMHMNEPVRKPTKSAIVSAVERVSKRLGNTKAVCRKCYVHPLIFDAYLDGTLVETLSREADRELKQRAGALRPLEAAVLTLLKVKLGKARSRASNYPRAH